ncbi:MAG: class I SAM-dependent methyltransferase [Thermoanaerobaculia bacterium]|nr:class I SAM-dependent methyltransferase [Thermoanaerobaculia bacterium]
MSNPAPPPAPTRPPADGLETPRCLLCGAPPPPTPGYAFAPYGVVRCPACGLWYLSPRLNEAAMVAAYREASYFEGGAGPGYSSYLAQEPTLRRTFRRLLRSMQRLGMTRATGGPDTGSRGGRLLEIGCAYGFFLDEARPYFAYRAGTEYSEAGAELARQCADAVHVGGLAALPGVGSGEAGERFDTIVLIHTIEHVYDPAALLEGLMEHLAPGGWIVLATPDMGGFWRPLLGRFWPFFKTPEHVAFYTAKSLAALLRRAGCSAVKRLPYLSYFPLSLVGEKLTPGGDGKGREERATEAGASAWSRFAVWVPATTVAAAGRKPVD